jgi:hypothetical protein
VNANGNLLKNLMDRDTLLQNLAAVVVTILGLHQGRKITTSEGDFRNMKLALDKIQSIKELKHMSSLSVIP